MEVARATFYRIGWLLPAAMPLAQVGGRALFNILAGVYFVWGLLALMGSRVIVQRYILVLYVLLIIAMAMSAMDAVDAERALRKAAEFLAHSMAFFLTLMVLQSDSSRILELVRAFALSGGVLLILLYIHLACLLPEETFQPQLQLKEDNLPFLIPLLLYVAASLLQRPLPKSIAAIGIILLACVYIGYSGGRAAFLGLSVALALYFVLVVRRKWYEVLPVVVLAVLIGLVSGAGSFDRNTMFPDAPEAWIETFDRFSGDRISLWRHALENRPDNLLFGVGMGNAGFAESAMETRHGIHVKHLHNFVLDAWYEIGIVGLTLLVTLLLVLFRAGCRALRSRTIQGRQVAGVFLSSGAALVVAGLLSFSYGSRQFSLYLFVILAAAYALYQSAEAPD